MRASMQQPALRLALLTFATMLVSGCAEQFAANMLQSAWIMAPMEGHVAREGKTSTRESDKQVTDQGTLRRSSVLSSPWLVAGGAALGTNIIHVSEPVGALSAVSYELRQRHTGDGRVMRVSDYRRERVG